MSNNFLVRQILKASIAIGILSPIVLNSSQALADTIYTTNIPTEAVDDLKNINERGISPKTITFIPNGGYIILYGKNGVAGSTNNIPFVEFLE